MLYINILNIQIPIYGLLIGIGIVLANICAYLLIKKYKLSFDNFLLMECFGLLFAGVGAKILYFIVSFNEIDWSMFFNMEYFSSIMRGGFVFYGGLIGGFAGVLLSGKVFKIDVFHYLKIVAPVVPLGHAFGRFGCSAVGCCYGIPYSGIGHILYTNSLFAPNGIELFPVQFTESICLLCLSGYLLYRTLHQNYEKNIYIYFYSYAVIRFVLEFFRYDAERGSIGILSTSQFVSIAILIVTTIIQIQSSKAKKNLSV